MKTFLDFLKETNQAMRRARAYVDSLISNAEKVETVLSGNGRDAIGSGFIAVSAKLALDKRQPEWNAIAATSKAVAEYETSAKYQERIQESLLKLVQQYSFEISDACDVLGIVYGEYIRRQGETS